MKCFEHLDRDAIGLCIVCQRGLCPECAADLKRGLACKARCESEAGRLIDLRDFSFAQPNLQRSMLKRTANNVSFAAIYMLCFGPIFAAVGYFSGSPFPIIYYVGGGLLSLLGLAQLLRARRLPDQNAFRLCAHCGYNISGAPNRHCPECGKIN